MRTAAATLTVMMCSTMTAHAFDDLSCESTEFTVIGEGIEDEDREVLRGTQFRYIILEDKVFRRISFRDELKEEAVLDVQQRSSSTIFASVVDDSWSISTAIKIMQSEDRAEAMETWLRLKESATFKLECSIN